MDGAGSGSVTLKTLSCANTTKKLEKEVTEEVITSFSSSLESECVTSQFGFKRFG